MITETARDLKDLKRADDDDDDDLGPKTDNSDNKRSALGSLLTKGHMFSFLDKWCFTRTFSKSFIVFFWGMGPKAGDALFSYHIKI
jgi:hypothetical protein